MSCATLDYFSLFCSLLTFIFDQVIHSGGSDFNSYKEYTVKGHSSCPATQFFFPEPPVLTFLILTSRAISYIERLGTHKHRHIFFPLFLHTFMFLALIISYQYMKSYECIVLFDCMNAIIYLTSLLLTNMQIVF